jgi:hypothetical protein
MVEHHPSDDEQPGQVRQAKGGLITVANGPAQHEAPGPTGRTRPPLFGLDPAGLLLGDGHGAGGMVVPGSHALAGNPTSWLRTNRRPRSGSGEQLKATSPSRLWIVIGSRRGPFRAIPRSPHCAHRLNKVDVSARIASCRAGPCRHQLRVDIEQIRDSGGARVARIRFQGPVQM